MVGSNKNNKININNKTPMSKCLLVVSVMGSDRGLDVAVKCPKDMFFKDKNMGEGSVMSGVTIGKFMCVVFCRMFPEALHCHIS